MEDCHTAKIISVKESTKTCRMWLSAGRNISRLNKAYVLLLLLLLLLSLLSPLCRVSTTIYLKQTMFLGYSVPAVLYLPFVLHVMLIRPWNTFCIFTLTLFRDKCAVPNMAIYCSSFISCFLFMLLRYCLSDFEMDPVASIITGITFFFTFRYYHYHHHHHHLLYAGIYTYVPETNYVPREYSVAAILLLLFMVLISLVSLLNLLYFYISTFRSMCAVSNMAVSGFT